MEQHVYMFTTVACVSYEKKAWTVVVGQQFHRASNHLTSQTIEHKKAKIYGDGNPGPGLGHSQNVAGKTG